MLDASLTRRRFALCLGAAALPLHSADAGEPWSGPAVVHKVFLGTAKMTWPYPTINLKQEMADINAHLADLESKNPGLVRFTGGELLLRDTDLEGWVRGTAGADAILVMDLTTSTSPQFRMLDKLETPLLLFQRPITSWAYMNFAEYIRQGKKADMVNSSDYSDLVPHLHMLYAMHHLRNSKVLVVQPGADRAEFTPWTRRFGTAVELPSYQEFKAACDSVPAARTEDAAREFTRNALRVVEPKPADISSSVRFHLAALEVMRKAKANALTIDCLGGFERGDLTAYPCVAFSKLNDAGLYGVCEADFPSTMTQMLITAYSGMPGFVSDPTFDTSRNEVIHAHCVAATRLRGLGARPSPYSIRTHMEDEKGVSIQVEMPIRETITCAKLAGPETLLISKGEVIANLDDRRGCRTKIVTRVTDARKMAEGYTGGLHRVLFYGDHLDAAERMGRLIGYRTVREC